MLARLHVRNFALIDEVEIEFRPGLNVLTGETGAGKSILIDAITAALGERVSADWVRSGADRALIEVCFEVDPQRMPELAEWAEEGVLILSREIAASGRSVARLNGRLSTAGVLREAARYLIDIHGQHEHQSLLHPERHADFLDAWAGPTALALRRQAEAEYAALRAARAALEALRRDERERAQRIDLYRFQIEEIAAAALRPGEEEELLADRMRLAHAEKLAAGAAAAREALLDGEVTALDLLAQAAHQIRSLAEIDGGLAPIADALEGALATADDAARELRRYQEGIEFNPQRLEQVQERLETLRQLRRKYGDTIEEILAYQQKIALELADLEGGEGRVEALAAEIAERSGAFAAAAQALHATRLAAAERLAAEVQSHLADLAMERTRVHLAVAPPDPGAEAGGLASMLGRVEFLLAPNPGEPERPLARIASGGELSRVMLALKSALAGASPVPTWIFDEIDSGVGGQTGLHLGAKLGRLARHHQILCVTHLATVACAAETHFVVEKIAAGDRTEVRVRQLTEEERVGELARMLGGAPSTAIEHARQLLAAARAPAA